MKKMRSLRVIRMAISLIVIFVFVLLGLFGFDIPDIVHAQQPTGSIATVTGTPKGPTARVDPSLTQGIKVYAGPSTFDYLPIGYLLANEVVPVLGRAAGKDDWLAIYYPGVPDSMAWVYALYISELSPGIIPIIEIPATPTPNSTPTINPTLEAAFIGQQTPTRLPTFTPPPPLDETLFTDVEPARRVNVPVGLIILSLGVFGFFGAFISYLRGR